MSSLLGDSSRTQVMGKSAVVEFSYLTTQRQGRDSIIFNLHEPRVPQTNRHIEFYMNGSITTLMTKEQFPGILSRHQYKTIEKQGPTLHTWPSLF